MTLHLIGLGLSDEKDITVKGLETIKRCKYIYLENYTGTLQCTKESLEKFYGKPITEASRDLMENRSAELLNNSKDDDVAVLVIGDPMAATTHISLLMEAKEKGIKVNIIHNASILTAIGITGLQLYKFGKTTSIPFTAETEDVEVPYTIIKENQEINAHTLVLLDLNPEEKRFLTVSKALDILLRCEKRKGASILNEQTHIIALAGIGSDNQVIKAGSIAELLKWNVSIYPQSLIIPAKTLHFVEEEAMNMWDNGE